MKASLLLFWSPGVALNIQISNYPCIEIHKCVTNTFPHPLKTGCNAILVARQHKGLFNQDQFHEKLVKAF